MLYLLNSFEISVGPRGSSRIYFIKPITMSVSEHEIATRNSKCMLSPVYKE